MNEKGKRRPFILGAQNRPPLAPPDHVASTGELEDGPEVLKDLGSLREWSRVQAQLSLREKPPECPAAKITVLLRTGCPRSLGCFTSESSKDLFLTMQMKE